MRLVYTEKDLDRLVEDSPLHKRLKHLKRCLNKYAITVVKKSVKRWSPKDFVKFLVWMSDKHNYSTVTVKQKLRLLRNIMEVKGIKAWQGRHWLPMKTIIDKWLIDRRQKRPDPSYSKVYIPPVQRRGIAMQLATTNEKTKRAERVRQAALFFLVVACSCGARIGDFLHVRWADCFVFKPPGTDKKVLAIVPTTSKTNKLGDSRTAIMGLYCPEMTDIYMDPVRTFFETKAALERDSIGPFFMPGQKLQKQAKANYNSFIRKYQKASAQMGFEVVPTGHSFRRSVTQDARTTETDDFVRKLLRWADNSACLYRYDRIADQQHALKTLLATLVEK